MQEMFYQSCQSWQSIKKSESFMRMKVVTLVWSHLLFIKHRSGQGHDYRASNVDVHCGVMNNSSE